MMFQVMFTIVFIMFVCVFASILVRGVSQWHKNNNSPRLTVEAKIVDKRSDYHHHHGGVNHASSSSTYYYATFEVESGDRMELQIPSNQFGYLIVGDRGRLTFQGTRFLEFIRR